MNIKSTLQKNIAGKLLNHCIVFLVNIALVRKLNPDQSGAFFNELYLLNTLVFICSMGMDFASIAWISREPLLAPVIHKRLTGAVVLFMSMATIAVFYFIPEKMLTGVMPAVSIIFFTTGNLMLILFQGFLTAGRKFNLQNTILIFSNTFFLFFLLFVSDLKVSQIAFSYAILFFIQGLLLAVCSYSAADTSGITINWKSFLRYGSLTMLSSVIYFVFLRIDNFFVEKYCDAVVLSNYVQCGKLGQYFIYFSSVISATLLPFISSEKIANDYSEWKALMKPYVLLILSGAVIMILGGKWIFPFIFGEAFSPMYQYMSILVPGYVCLGMLTLMNSIYYGTGNIHKILRGDLMGLIVVTILDVIFIPRWGVYAAAIISSFAYFLVFLYLRIDLKNQFGSVKADHFS